MPPTTVLVVEDEALVRFDVVDQLEGEGYRVLEAQNADQAIAILEANSQIQILFTDIDMPGSMDGLKLAAAVRDRWPPVKVIVTSGHRLVEITDLPDGSVFFSKPWPMVGASTSLQAQFRMPLESQQEQNCTPRRG